MWYSASERQTLTLIPLVAVGKSLMESDMSVGVLTADPADRILFRALRVANREFVYTVICGGRHK